MPSSSTIPLTVALPSTPAGDLDLNAGVVMALAGIADGDEQALHVLYTLMSTPMYSLALAVTGDLGVADDALVASFIQIWRTRACRPPGAGAPWVMDLACATARSMRHGANRTTPDDVPLTV